MDALREIVRGIAIIIIFAGFLEMLLPQNEMRRYLQVIVGLFIIVSIIAPLSELVANNKSFEVVSWQYIPQDNTQAILEKGKNMAKEGTEQLRGEEEKRITSQIDALAKLHNEVEATKVEIVKSGDALPKVKVKLEVTKALSDKEKSVLAIKVSETVTAFFGFPSEQIEITF